MTRAGRNAAGFTLIELLIVVAILGILAAIIIPVYANVQVRARIAKAQADTRAIASALTIYTAHCGGFPDNTSAATNCPTAMGQTGAMPAALSTAQTNAQKQVGGPFMNSAPSLPGGWTGSGASYKYSTFLGTFLVCANGDGTAADSSGGSSCP